MTIDIKTAKYNVLRKYAQELGLVLNKTMTKVTIIKMIEDKLALKIKAVKPNASKIAINKEVKVETTKKVNQIKKEESAPLKERVVKLEIVLAEYLKANTTKRQLIKDTISADKKELVDLSNEVAKDIKANEKLTTSIAIIDTIIAVETEEVVEKASWLDGIMTSQVATVNTSEVSSWMNEFVDENLINPDSDDEEEEEEDDYSNE